MAAQPTARGRLRIGDDWNAITIIALSQDNPLKAVAEFVENSIDAGARSVTITRGRERGEHYLEITDEAAVCRAMRTAFRTSSTSPRTSATRSRRAGTFHRRHSTTREAAHRAHRGTQACRRRAKFARHVTRDSARVQRSLARPAFRGLRVVQREDPGNIGAGQRDLRNADGGGCGGLRPLRS